MATTKKESSVLEEVVSNIREEINEKNDAKHLIYLAGLNQKIDEYLSYIDACVADIEKYIKDNIVDDSIVELADEITREELMKLEDKYSRILSSYNPYGPSASYSYASLVAASQTITGTTGYATPTISLK